MGNEESRINEGLDNLGVNVQSQSSLEKQIENDVQNYTIQQQIEQEEKRLERAKNALNKCLKKKKLLERRLKLTTRISVKAKLREEIAYLEENEEYTLRQDIQDVKQRLKSNLNSLNSDSQKTETDRRPDESERLFS